MIRRREKRLGSCSITRVHASTEFYAYVREGRPHQSTQVSIKVGWGFLEGKQFMRTVDVRIIYDTTKERVNGKQTSKLTRET
jgi:hypothetical protein